MSSFAFNSIFNSSLIDALTLYWDTLTTFLSGVAISLHEIQNNSALNLVVNLPDNLHFNEFQCKLLKGFTVILVINLLLICVAWKVYRRNICERFMRLSASKTIEELKASVSKLKLPKEHSPHS